MVLLPQCRCSEGMNGASSAGQPQPLRENKRPTHTHTAARWKEIPGLLLRMQSRGSLLLSVLHKLSETSQLESDAEPLLSIKKGPDALLLVVVIVSPHFLL